MRLRVPMAWQDVQTQGAKYLSTIYNQQSPQPMDISAVLTCLKWQSFGSQTHQRNDCWHKDETWKTCGKREHLVKVCRRGNAQTPSNAPAKVLVNVQAKAKARHKQLKYLCAWKGRTQESRLQIQDCNMFKLRKGRALEGGVSKHEHTHEIEKGADEPSPEVTVEEVWCMSVQDVVDGGRCACTEKHDVLSEHRDESKFEEFPEHRDEKNFKELTERRHGSKFWKSHHDLRDGSKFWKNHHERRDGSKFKKSHREHRDGSKVKTSQVGLEGRRSACGSLPRQ